MVPKRALKAYRNIFTANPRARYFSTTYVDAFAGTGERQDSADDSAEYSNIQNVQAGSARIALSLDSPFDQYLFVEKKRKYAKALEELKKEFPTRKITIAHDDANTCLQGWCATVPWTDNRAVVFLDPYGMQVDWKTIEDIAKTRAIDLWIWFPLGQAVNRLLTTDGLPSSANEAQLTRMFGKDDWKDAFYKPPVQPSLFDIGDEREKVANFDMISQYFLGRLGEVFAAVASNPRYFYNKNRNPLYALYFAAGNPKGAPTAVNIAQNILKK